VLRRRGYRLGSPGRLPRIFRAAFGADRRQDIAKYVIAVEVSGLVMLATGV
jgi:hypothetical protein